jgi:uncharacterized protein YrrD
MLALSSTLRNRPILSLRSGGEIGTTIEPIINPNNLQIIGWWCSNVAESENNVLLISDIREVLPRGVVVDDLNNFSHPADLARHKEVLDTNYQLVGKLVKTERHKIGKVTDYCYDDTFLIQKLYVEQSLLKALAQDTRIIGRSQIIEVTDHYILVKDTEMKVGEKQVGMSKKLSQAFLSS